MALNTALSPQKFSADNTHPKKITILGSTGSIGQNTVDVLCENLDKFDVEVLVAKSNFKKLAEQALALDASHVVIQDEQFYPQLQELLKNSTTKVHAGQKSVLDLCSHPVDIAVAAIVGIDGLLPNYTIVEHTKILAIANKESLVSGGVYLIQKAQDSNTVLLPIDSEHNALAQIYNRDDRPHIRQFILTASGGPFRTYSHQQLKNVTFEKARQHPNWSMGVKNSIDSATLMNKGLEVIETAHFFQIPESCIDVLIHPQSIVHSLISFEDGAMLAQLSSADMRIPISHCLSWPQRMQHKHNSFDVGLLSELNFYPPNNNLFPAINICRSAYNQGQEATTVLNAANEIAVEAFEKKQISFCDIVKLVENALESGYTQPCKTIQDILDLDLYTKQKLRQKILKGGL